MKKVLTILTAVVLIAAFAGSVFAEDNNTIRA